MVGIYSEQVPVDDVHDALKFLYTQDRMISIATLCVASLATHFRLSTVLISAAWHLRKRFLPFPSTRIDSKAAKQAVEFAGEAKTDDEGASSKDDHDDEDAGVDVRTVLEATASPRKASEDDGKGQAADTETRWRVGRGHQAALERIITRRNTTIEELKKKLRVVKKELNKAKTKLNQAERVDGTIREGASSFAPTGARTKQPGEVETEVKAQAIRKRRRGDR